MEKGKKVRCDVALVERGLADSREHAIESAKLVTAAKPEYLGLLTLNLEPDAPLYKDYVSGKFEAQSPFGDLEEQKIFLEHVDSEGTVLRSNHVSNYVSLSGTLNRDKERMIAQLDAAISSGRIRPERYRRL